VGGYDVSDFVGDSLLPIIQFMPPRLLLLPQHAGTPN
jgi:hypothetical protein